MAEIGKNPFAQLNHYELRHLVVHLEKAERVDDVHHLLQIEVHRIEQQPYKRRDLRGLLDRIFQRHYLRSRTSSANAWFMVHEQIGDISGYLSDIARAWQLAEQVSARQVAQEQSAPTVGLETRYALLTASMNTVAGNVPTKLLVALVDKHVWSPAEALALTSQIPDLKQYAKGLAALGPYLPEQLLRKALEMAQAIEDNHSRATSLAALVPQLARVGHVEEAMSVVKGMEHDEFRDEALAMLAPLIAKSCRFSEAIELAQAIRYREGRVSTSAELLSYLPERERKQVLEQALSEVRAVSDHLRPHALVLLAPHLTKEALLIEIRAIESGGWQSRAFVELAPYLDGASPRHEPSDELKRILEEIQKPLAAGRVIEDEWQKARALAEIAPHLTEALLREVLETIRVLPTRSYRMYVLAEIAPYLSQSLLQEAVEDIHKISDENDRTNAMIGMAPYLPESQLRKVLTEVWKIRHTEDLMRLLAKIAPCLTEPLLWEALARVRGIDDEHCRARALAYLAPHLTQEMLPQALKAARAIKEKATRVSALTLLVPYLPPPQRRKALLQALATARKIRNKRRRAVGLAKVGGLLTEPNRQETLQQALSLARAQWLESDWVEALTEVAPYLTTTLLWEALEWVKRIQYERPRASLLASFAPYLIESQLRKAIDEARAICDEDYQGQALAELLTQLARSGCGSEALAAARAIEDEDWRDWSLIALIPHLPEQELPGMLSEVNAIRRERERVEALVALVSRLREPHKSAVLRTALDLTQRIQQRTDQARTLEAIAPHLAALPISDIYPFWREILRRSTSGSRSALLENLNALSPVLAALGGSHVIVETLRAVQNTGLWWAESSAWSLSKVI